MDQASGMVCIQAHCSFAEAAELMRKRAEQTHRSVEDVAYAVLDHTIDFGA
jgi:ANTAR domain